MASSPSRCFRARRHNFALAALGCATLLAGCDGSLVNGYFLLDTPQRAYVGDTFVSQNNGTWEFSARNENDWFVDGGYYVSRGPKDGTTSPTYLVGRWDIPGNLDVRVSFDVWYAYGMAEGDNGYGYDFRVVLADPTQGDITGSGANLIGPAVELKLNEIGSPNVNQYVTIYGALNDGSKGIAGSSITGPSAVSGGTLDILFILDAEVPHIDVVADFGAGREELVGTLEVPDGWSERVRPRVEAVGYFDNAGAAFAPRAIGSVYFLQPEVE